MPKFNRNYYCFFYIGKNEGKNTKYTKEIEIKMPISMELDISISTSGQPNTCNLRFYNLSNFIQKDLWLDIYNRSDKRIRFYLYAGYGDNTKNLPLVFCGDVMACSSYRSSGSVDNITEVQAISGQDIFTFGYSNATFEYGTKYSDIVELLINDLPDIKLGYISDKMLSIPRNQTFLGKTISLLRRELSGLEIFEDKGRLHILSENEIIPGQIQTISETSGLLGTPRIAQEYLEVDTIFEPGLRVGQIIKLETDYELIENQTYKIVSLRHNGIISPTVCGNLTTTATLFLGSLKNEWKRAKTKAETKYKELTEIVNTSGWIKPVEGKITSPFGKRIQPIAGASTNHKGIDIDAKAGDYVRCPYDGKVAVSSYYGGYGNYILINHGKNKDGIIITSEYGHLQKYLVKAGDTVTKGNIIGIVGSTGVSTGPHLHFGIMEDGKNVNPTKYVRY